jgi:hypothetical protein
MAKAGCIWLIVETTDEVKVTMPSKLANFSTLSWNGGTVRIVWCGAFHG